MLIPTQLQNSEFRFILLKASEELDNEGRPIGKAPKELNWQTTKNYDYKQIQEQFEKQTDIAKIRAGIIPKYGNLFFIDVDKKGKHFESISLLVESLAQTFTVKTYSGGKHYYFICKDAENKNFIDNSGEIRADRRYILAGNSRLRGKEYQVIKDIPIAEVDWKEILAVLDDYLIKTIEKKPTAIKTGIQTQTIQNILDNKRDIKLQTLLQGNWSAYTSRSEAEMALVQKLVFYNLTKEQVFEIMESHSKLEKWKEKPDRYKEMTYSKALLMQPEKVTEIKQKPVEETIKSILKIKNVEELFNLKPNKDFIVDQFIYPQNLIMLFSPPKNYKSLLALKLCMDISNGRKFFGLKTKKSNVLYCDRENNENLIHQRLHALRKANPKEYRRKKFPLHFLIRQGDLDNELWVRQLIDTIKKHHIKVVVFDTMKRYSTNFDENNANDVNRIYTGVYQPLIDECNCSILFLHHTNKRGEFRGSGDFLGMVDSAYSIEKINNKNNDFKISCLAARGGEIDQIQGSVDLEQDSHKQLTFFKFIQKSKEEIQEKSSEDWLMKKRACDMIMSLFKIKNLQRIKRSVMWYDISMQKKDEIKEITFKRALDHLVYKEILRRDGQGWYTKIDNWVILNE